MLSIHSASARRVLTEAFSPITTAGWLQSPSALEMESYSKEGNTFFEHLPMPVCCISCKPGLM